MKRFLIYCLAVMDVISCMGATSIVSYVQVNPPVAPQPGGFNMQTGTVGSLTDTGLAANQCVQTLPGGLLGTSGGQCGSGAAGGGTSSLETMINTLHLSSPTPTLNIVGQGVVGSLVGSTATFTFPFAQIAADTTTIGTNYLSNSSATATYLQQTPAANTYLSQSSATATYLQTIPAIATYLQLSSATATYLQSSSATATYLQSSSATVTYCHGNGVNCTAGALTLTGDIVGSGLGTIATAASPLQTNIKTFTSSITITNAGGLTLENIASGVQCVHANANGQLEGTGSDCGSGGSGTPGGSNTQIQYNNAGSFGGTPIETVDSSSVSFNNISSVTYQGFSEVDMNGINFNGTSSTFTFSSGTVKGQLTAGTLNSGPINVDTDISLNLLHAYDLSICASPVVSWDGFSSLSLGDPTGACGTQSNFAIDDGPGTFTDLASNGLTFSQAAFLSDNSALTFAGAPIALEGGGAPVFTVYTSTALVSGSIQIASNTILSGATFYQNGPSVFSNQVVVSTATFNGFTFAALGSATNGTFEYCSDCTVTTPATCVGVISAACVCAGSGNGAFAKRLNGSWYCN